MEDLTLLSQFLSPAFYSFRTGCKCSYKSTLWLRVDFHSQGGTSSIANLICLRQPKSAMAFFEVAQLRRDRAAVATIAGLLFARDSRCPPGTGHGEIPPQFVETCHFCQEFLDNPPTNHGFSGGSTQIWYILVWDKVCRTQR